jgi:hypothetical protein
MWRREGIPLYTLHFTERNTNIDQTMRYQGTKSRLLAHDHSGGIESNQQPKSKRTKTTRVQYSITVNERNKRNSPIALPKL